MAGPLLAVRLESTRLAPEASVWFEPNHGQVGGRTEWTARAAGAWLFLTSNEVVYALPPEIHFDPKKTRGVPTAKTTNVHMRIVGGRRVKGVGEKALGGYSNYFLGKHEDEWFTGVPHFGQVRFPEVYPGIDVVFYTTGRNVEYDFIVKPGADPSAIELKFEGVSGVRVDGSGNLAISAGGKTFYQHRPRVFQGNREVEASYQISDVGSVRFRFGGYDMAASLRVDPVLDFSTYLGGPGEDYFNGIALALDGNPILIGTTQSPQSPTLDPFSQPNIVSWAVIILKMSADGRRVIAYTILGRNSFDRGNAVAVDRDGSVVIGGNTRSANFPLKNPFQSEFKAIWDNAFVAKLSPDLRSLIYSSYMGGSNLEGLSAVALDDLGNAYFGGGTQSADYPTVAPIQARSAGGGNDWFLSKISPEGRMLTSTYLGGDGGDVLSGLCWRKDQTLVGVGMSTNGGFPLKEPIQPFLSQRIGQTHHVMAIFSTSANAVVYSTYFGGTSTGSAYKVSCDGGGNIYVTGDVNGGVFPLQFPIFSEPAEGTNNSFLTVFRPDGKERLFSTLIPAAWAHGIALDTQGNIYVGGTGYSAFGLKDSLQGFRGGGIQNGDHFIAKFSPGGKPLVYSTLLGGSGNELGISLAAGPDGALFFTGATGSSDFPVKTPYQRESGGSTDGIFGRITDNSIPPVPAFSSTPSNLAFRHVQGEAPPAAASIAIDKLNEAAAIRSNQPWLRVSPAALASSGKVQVTLDLAGLTPGVHRGSIQIVPASGAAGSVDVVLTLLAAAPLLSSADPARVAIGTDDTEITLRGSGFTNRTTVQWQTVAWNLTPVRFVDASTLRFMLPKAYFSTEFNHSFTVQNPDSAVSRPVSLAVGRPAPAIGAKGIVSAASYAGDVISPGEILTLFGENFEQGMRVNFDGLLATPLYITPGQLSVVAPTGLTGAREVNVIVEMNFDWRSIPVRIPVWPARPGLFTANSSGKGQAAALNQDGSVNSPANPAVKGSIAVLYGTGGGVENLPTKVFIDGIECEVLYAGQAPGLIAGAWQLNVRIPEFASKGEVVWRAGERESVEGVFVSLKEN